MTENNFGERLKARRKEKGLTLAEVEALSGVDKSHLGRIENSKRFPTANILRKLTGPLGYGEVELLIMAGYLSPDRTDKRLVDMKKTMKGEIKGALSNLLKKVDTL